MNLIIHDECHSVINDTTKSFYEFILDKNKETSCIGFSATPTLELKPYDKIISSYSMYDAFKDNIILPAKIKWLDCDDILSQNNILPLVKKEIDKLYYKKIIIWCGMISLCYELAEKWKEYFPNFLIATDTSDTSDKNNKFKSFDEFNKLECNGILFCAGKHREGSDIQNLDACVFLDKVENRNPKTFVQCIGRVLRKDKDDNKKYGLVIDLKASSCLNICDRINEYLNFNSDTKISFPWKYKYKTIFEDNKKIVINQLKMTKPKEKNSDDNSSDSNSEYYSSKDLKERFILKCPEDKVYIFRMKRELKLIKEKNLASYLIRATEILKLTNYIPHVTRGSCGSSLICYLMSIDIFFLL